MKQNVGDHRFLLSMLSIVPVEAAAKLRGWREGDSYFDYVDVNSYGTEAIFTTLALAEDAARAFLATGNSVYGCCLIEDQELEAAHDDLGRTVRMPPSWETVKTYEVAMDGETIIVENN